MKKILSLILCLLMLISIVPLSASAGNGEVVKVDQITIKTDSIFQIGELVPNKFEADFKDNGFSLSEVDWKETEIGKDWVPGTDMFDIFAGDAGDRFEQDRGYRLVLAFEADRTEYDVKEFTLKTRDNTYTSYETSHFNALNSNNGTTYYTEYFTLAYFYIPISGLFPSVTTYDELKAALESSDTFSIKLANDISKEIPLGDSAGGEAAQITIGGKKALNLNGYKLTVRDRSDVTSDKDRTAESFRTLFTVPAGAEFIVDDSAGKGEVKYDAHFISPSALFFDEAKYYFVPERNMFDVEGKLTVYGGNFIAGGAKKQYLSDYSVNAYQIAPGYIVDTNETGEANFYGGNFTGHTYFYNGHWYKEAPYYVLQGDGVITVDGASFVNKGVGKFCNCGNLKIINGSFDADTYSKIRETAANTTQNFYTDGAVSANSI